MYRLFKRRKQVNKEGAQGRLRHWITGMITRFQKRWATLMGRWMERLSVGGKKATVIAFCIAMAGYCTWLIYQGFYADRLGVFPLTPIQTPAHVTQTGEVNIAREAIIPETEYQHIRAFRQYIDSLRATIDGSRLADSLLLFHPGLMDSIDQFEQLYRLQQLKTK